MFLLIFFASTAIGISFLCSVMEAALLSITPSFIAQLEEKNPKWFKQVNALKQDIDTPLAAILTLNTIAHTVAPPASVPRLQPCTARPTLALPPAL